MRQVGCASASARVTSASSLARPAAERAARGGQDDRVDGLRARGPRGTGRAPSARCRPAGAGLPPLLAASASSPAATRLSLFASASVTPRSSAHSVAGRPAKPTTALRTTSGSARSRSAVRSPPTWACSTPRSAASSSSVVRARGERAHLELRIGVDDLERLAPDRAGRAEDGDSLHPQSVRPFVWVSFGTNASPIGANFADTMNSGGGPRWPSREGLSRRRRRRAPRSRRRPTRRAARRCGRARLRGPRGAGPSPSPPRRA